MLPSQGWLDEVCGLHDAEKERSAYAILWQTIAGHFARWYLRLTHGLRSRGSAAAVGEFACRFNHLFRYVIRGARFIPRNREVRCPQQLLFAISQSVANCLLYLRFGKTAQPGRLPR